MRVFLILILFFISNISFSQYECYNLLSKKLNNLDILPYVLYNKIVYENTSGKTFYIKLDDLAFRTKLIFILQSNNLGDSLDVSLVTLNNKILNRKIITNKDCTLRCDPLKKTENYFLIVKSKPVLDEFKRPISGCLGIAILERVKRKPFKKIQKIEWK